jgi:hypothetical protein
MAINFDGTNDYIALGSDLPLLNGQVAATLMGWLLPDTVPAGDARIASLGIGPPPGATSSSRIALGTSATTFMADAIRNADGDAISANLAPSGTMVAGVWQHLCITYNCSTKSVTWYHNGGSLGSNTAAFASGTAFSATNMKNGALGSLPDGSGSRMDGKVADVRIYNRVLSASEIQAIFNSYGADGITFGLEARYKMAEGADGIAVGSAPPEVTNCGSAALGKGAGTNGPTFFGSPYLKRRRAR